MSDLSNMVSFSDDDQDLKFSHWNSALRKLQNPFLCNDLTRKAALATLKASKRSRGGWNNFIGLRGGAPPESGMKVSTQPIKGHYEGSHSDLTISFHDSELTFVNRFENRVPTLNFKAKMVLEPNQANSLGEAVEKSVFIDEEVYKKIWTRGGVGENEVEINEFRLEAPHLPATHSSKLIGSILYQFRNDNGVEKVEVIFSNLYIHNYFLCGISDYKEVAPYLPRRISHIVDQKQWIQQEVE